MMVNQKICSRCVLDTTVPNIRFDEKGVCNYCKIHDELEKKNPLNERGQQRLNQLVNKIKNKGKNNEYDCVVGVSGGRDSTYTLYIAVKLGLRPLAVHFDNGWNSEIAVSNIKKATTKLDVDLHTVVADWEEFKDLQLSFLKASVPDAEIPTDYSIISVLYQTAAEIGTNYILTGHSFRTEGVSPMGWTYQDGRYIKSVHKKFGKIKVKSFPILMLSELLYYIFIKKIKYVDLLDCIDYRQKEAGEIMKKELDWEYYGGHHHENIYTHFFQSYLLPEKFNIDKRKTEYSALIRSGQMTREKALKEIRENSYPYDKEIVNYTISKLGLTTDEFEEMLSVKPMSFHDYPTYYSIIKLCRIPIKGACKLNLLPHVFYEKYLG